MKNPSDELPIEDEVIIEDDLDEPENVSPKWRVLVVDDDEGVHQSTSFAIRGAKILGKEVDLVHAKSAREAMDILSRDDGFELAIVDVVMENKHAGLDLAKWIRSKRSLENTRIMLRTGQPGEVSEESVFEQGDVDDFRLKSELSHLRLISAMTALLRSWKTGMKLSQNAKFMGDLAIKAASMAKARSREELCVRAAQTIEELSKVEGVAVALAKKGQKRRWILMEGAINQVEHFLKKMGLEHWMAEVDLKPGASQTLVVDQGRCVCLEIKSQNESVMTIFAKFAEENGEWSKDLFIEVMSQALSASMDAIEAMEALEKQAYVDAQSGLPNAHRLRREVATRSCNHNQVALCALAFDDGVDEAWGASATSIQWMKAVADALPARVSGNGKLFRLGQKSVAMVCEVGQDDPLKVSNLMLEVGNAVAEALGGFCCVAGVAPSLGMLDSEELIKRAKMSILDARREGAHEPIVVERAAVDVEKWQAKAKEFEQAIASGSFRCVYSEWENGEGQSQWDFGLEMGLGLGLGSRWHDKGASKRLAGYLGLSSQYDLQTAHEALKLAQRSGKFVWIELSQGSLRSSGMMGKVVEISKISMENGAKIGWIIPEDDPFWSIADYETWLVEMGEAGASIALGGFGLGYSSLSKLGAGPWSVIRLHESLTKTGDWESLGSNAKIVRASLSLCSAFGIQAACVMPKSEKAMMRLLEMASQIGGKPFWRGGYESHAIESTGG